LAFGFLRLVASREAKWAARQQRSGRGKAAAHKASVAGFLGGENARAVKDEPRPRANNFKRCLNLGAGLADYL
jgi:hypothetical protein